MYSMPKAAIPTPWRTGEGAPRCLHGTPCGSAEAIGNNRGAMARVVPWERERHEPPSGIQAQRVVKTKGVCVTLAMVRQASRRSGGTRRKDAGRVALQLEGRVGKIKCVYSPNGRKPEVGGSGESARRDVRLRFSSGFGIPPRNTTGAIDCEKQDKEPRRCASVPGIVGFIKRGDRV